VLINPILLYKLGLSPEELTAALLHEIGHDFEYLKYTIFMAQKPQHILDQIVNVIYEEDAFDKIIEIVVKETKQNIDVKELDLGDKIKIIFNLPSTLFETSSKEVLERHNLSDIKIVNKEFETIADRFVSNFGLEYYLASGLNKLQTYINSAPKAFKYSAGILYTNLLIRTMPSIFNSILGPVLISIFSSMLYSNIFLPVYKSLYGKIPDDKKELLGDIIETLDRVFTLYSYALFISKIPILIRIPCILYTFLGSNGFMLTLDYIKNYREESVESLNPYENIDLRLDSIKRNLIEQLKNTDDIETKKYLLNEINGVEEEIRKSYKKFNSITNSSIIPFVVPEIKRTNDPDILNPVYILNRIIKEHINNDLYVHTVKLELMNNGS
jgi:hypothetical protein